MTARNSVLSVDAILCYALGSFKLFTSVSNVEMTSKLRLTFAERHVATSRNFKLIVKQKMSCVFLDFTANLHLLREPVTMVIQTARAGIR